MFLILFGLWVVFNGKWTTEIALLGVAVSGLIYAFTCAFIGLSPRKELHYLRNAGRGIAYLWLLLYLVASVITMALLLRDWETMRVFLHFVLWFAAIPVGLGLVLFTLLYRRDHHAPAPVEEEPLGRMTHDHFGDV